MSEKWDQIQDAIKAEIQGEIDEIRASAQPDAQLVADLVSTEERIALAIGAGDYSHVAKELGDHLPALGNREWLEDREERKAAWKARLQRILLVILNAVGVLVLFVMLPGCAALKTGSVTTPAIRGEMANVCGALDRCAAEGKIASSVQACNADDPTSLLSRMRASNVVDAQGMLVDLGKVCGQVDACVDAWPDLAEHEALAWPEWCETLEENARAAG